MDSNAKDTCLNRKQSLGKIGSIGKNLAKAVLPLTAIGTLTTEAKAQFDNLEIVRALNYLLQLEFMQELFYVRAIVSNGFLRGEIRTIFRNITTHHQGHVIYLKNTIARLGEDPAPQLDFDFTAEGQFNPFGDFDEFLMLAQVVQDTTVKAYKTQIEILHERGASDLILRNTMRIHSTEAREAYFMRSLRAQRGVDSLKGWISNADGNEVPELAEDVYTNEDTIVQNDVDVPSVTNATTEAVREGWDEPISRLTTDRVFQLFRTSPVLR